VLFPGPVQVLLVVVLLPVFPCPEVVSVVVVVWLFGLLPTFVVVVVVQVSVPFVLSNVPPEARHCDSEGEIACTGVGLNANTERDVAALSRAIRIVADISVPPMVVPAAGGRRAGLLGP
jgi:hypothetical protein